MRVEPEGPARGTFSGYSTGNGCIQVCGQAGAAGYGVFRQWPNLPGLRQGIPRLLG